MVNNLYLEQPKIIPRRKRRVNRRKIAKTKRKSTIFLSIALSLITLTAFFIARNSYISSKSTDLSYAVEYNFTNGLSSKDKLLRIQKMSLIYSDGETAIVEVNGLCKESPHKDVSITGNFKKDNNKSWHLESINS